MSANGEGPLDQIVERLLELARFAYGKLPEEPSLTRTQWAALHYFARANEYSRTVSAFSLFHATTPGTVSATISALVKRGLLCRRRSQSDRRTIYLALTDDGWDALRYDPSAVLNRALQALPDSEAETLALSLEALIRQVAREQDRPVFGVCSQCRHFDVTIEEADGRQRFECRRLDQPLRGQQTRGLCAGFEDR